MRRLMRQSHAGRHCVAVLVLCSLSHGLLLGGTIQGRVVERGHRTPLVGANVSVRNTHLGTVTDTDGRYILREVAGGALTLHFSIVGYKAKDSQVDVPADSSATVMLDAILDEQPVDMAEVVVQGRADKELESSARLTEKESNSIVNVIDHWDWHK